MKVKFTILILLIQSLWNLAQAQGGNTCALAVANPLVLNTVYANQSTCAKTNDYFIGNNCATAANYTGQDYLYYYCATSTGCLKVNLTNVSSGDIGKYAVPSLTAFNSCPSAANCINWDTANIPAAGTAVGPSLSIDVVPGQCIYFLVDVNDSGFAYSDCINFSIQATMTAFNNQLPGGNTCALAAANPLTLNTTISNHATCCAANDYTVKIGNDWFYYFCPPNDGCLDIQLLSLSPDEPGKVIRPYLSLMSGCPTSGGVSQVSYIDSTNSGFGFTVNTYVLGGQCYYLLIDADNLNCFNYSLSTVFTNSLVQSFGGNTCSAALSNPVVAGTAMLNQTTQCGGNDDTTWQGQDWMYAFCAPQNGCMDLNFTRLISHDTTRPVYPVVRVYEGCPTSGGSLVAEKIMFRLEYPNGSPPFINPAKDYFNSMHVVVDSSKCYYIVVDEKLFGDTWWMDFVDFDLTVDFSIPTTTTIGGGICSQAIAQPITMGSVYVNQTTCCFGNHDTSKKGEDKTYYFCSNQTGCVTADCFNISSGNALQTAKPVLSAYKACWSGFLNSYSKEHLFSPLTDTLMIRFNVDSGSCYYVQIDNQVSDSITEEAICANYDIHFSFDTITTQIIGGNLCADAMASPIVFDSLYTNQSTCCKYNNFTDHPGQDWMYYFCAPNNGCIEVTTKDCYTGDLGKKATPHLSLLDTCAFTPTYSPPIVILNYGTVNNLPADGPVLRANVDSGKCYFLNFDAGDKGTAEKSDCFNYDFKVSFSSAILSQGVGGNSCTLAFALPLQPDTIYQNQTTCCAINNDYARSGQDWEYVYCPTVDGCLTLNLLNCFAGEAGKQSKITMDIADTCVGMAPFIYTKEDDIFKDTIMNSLSAKINVKVGKCYHILIDGVAYSNAKSDCTNYDLQVIFAPTIIQTPGGNNCPSAMANQIVNNSTYSNQTTCCAGNNSTFKVGQDWYYSYCATKKGCLNVNMTDLNSVGDQNSTWAFLGASLLCPNGNFNNFIAQNSILQSGKNLPFGPFINLNVDSGQCYYIMVDDIDPSNTPNCINYKLNTNFTPFANQTPGGNNCITAPTQMIVMDSTYIGQSTCCAGNEYLLNNGQDWYYKTCIPQDGCVQIQLKNAIQGDPGKPGNIVIKVFNGCPDSAGTSLIANTTLSMIAYQTYTSQVVSFDAIAGQCYYIVVDANVLAPTYTSCAFYDLQTKFTPLQTAGANTCASALANPMVIDSLYNLQSNCAPCISNDYNGLNACGSSIYYNGKDWIYAVVAPSPGLLNIKLPNITNTTSNIAYVSLSVYNNYPGVPGACLAYANANIPGLASDSLSVNVTAYQGQIFYVLVDGNNSSCFNYNIMASMILNVNGCNNSDFESGDLTGWTPSIGYSVQGCITCPCPAPYYSTPSYVTAPNRHTIVNSGVDAYGGFTRVFLGTNSLQLGSNTAGALAEGIRQTFLVTANNSSFNYSYAVVLQDAGHAPNTQPFFKARMKDSIGNIIACTEYCVSASANIPGFMPSTNTPNIIYKPWSTVYVDLTNYLGTYVSIEFENGDCSDGSHFGYAYIDCSCAPSQVISQDTMCATDCDTLFAPLGYMNYHWSPGNSTNTYLPICPGVTTTYTVNFTTYTGCNIAIPYTVIVGSVLNITDTTNCLQGGTATAYVTGGAGIYSYSWNTTPPLFTQTITNVPNGTYTLTVTDGKCNTETHTVTLNNNPPNIGVLSTTPVSCNGGTDGAASIIGLPVFAGPFTYKWLTTPIVNDSVLSGVPIGVYVGVVTDSIGCTDTTTVSIGQPDTISIAINKTISCDSLSPSVVTATVIGGTPPYTYFWNTVPAQITNPANLKAGSYTLTVTDSKACSKTTIVTIPNYFYIATNVTTNNLCFGDTLGSVKAQIIAGAGSFTYSWSTLPIQSDSIALHLSNGTYTVTVTNANGCTRTKTVAITSPSQITISNTFTNSCLFTNTGIINPTYTGGTPNYTYSWNTTPIKITGSVSNLSAGNYIVTVTDANNCTKTRLFTIGNKPNATSTINYAICIGQSYFGHTISGTYIDTFVAANGCDSLRTLNLTVHPIATSTVNANICFGDNYAGYSNTGTYIDTLISAVGCDSVRTINLIVKQNSSSTINQTICIGQSYLGYSAAGAYVDTLINAVGCDSIRTLNLTISNFVTKSLTDTLCFGDTLMGYYATGIFIDTFANGANCDSIRTLNLYVYAKSTATINHIMCSGDTFLTYYNTGIYIDSFINSKGCDSVRTIILTIHAPTSSIINQTICSGQSYLGYTNAGIYIDTLINANGCDSIRTVNLTVYPISTNLIFDTICIGQNLFGYTSTGVYIDTFNNMNGCDSIRTLNLFVLPNVNATFSISICANQSYQGYNTSGVYTDIFIGSNGCDSIRKLFLTVHPIFERDTNITICIGDSYFAGGAFQTTPGKYKDTLSTVNACDSIVNTNLIFYNELLPVIIGRTEMCEGDSVTLAVYGFKHYTWNIGDTVNKIVVYNGGQFVVQVRNDNQCIGLDTIDILEHNLPDVQINYTVKDLCKLDTINLLATGANKYTWYTMQIGNFASNQNPFVYPIDKSPIKIYVEGEDAYQCINYDSVTLYYINCCGTLYVPNAFSPNGDGINDAFAIKSNAQKFEAFNLKIFNRFGQQIFETKDINEGWDGKFKGKLCDLSTYYYVISTKCYDAKETQLIKGDILLLK